jgi:ferredoxin-NADP reductase
MVAVNAHSTRTPSALVDAETLAVRAIGEPAEGVRLLTLAAPDGGPLAEWEPGAHVGVVLPSGLVRQYSLCGDPADRHRYQIAVLRVPDGRGGSRELHESVAVGDGLRVQGPRNHFRLEDADRYVFVAGGIGITPIVPMIREVARRRAEWRLAYGGRTAASMAFAEELVALDERRVELVPEDEHGLLDLPRILAPDPGAAVYCCGPEPLLAAAERLCSHGWQPGSLRVERFAPPDAGDPGAPFELVLARSGRRCMVAPDQSVLDALLEADADVLFSCTEGTCGTCLTTVLEGEPDHRDCVLTADERARGDCMLVCVSRSRGSRLVLDL